MPGMKVRCLHRATPWTFCTVSSTRVCPPFRRLVRLPCACPPPSLLSADEREIHSRGSAPQDAGELLRHGLAMFRPFADQEGRPIGGAGQAVAVGRAEA